MAQIKNIIFDGSGVITDERPRDTTKRLSDRFHIPFENIWRVVFLDNYYLARDGKINAVEYYRKSIDELKIDISYEEFIKEYIFDCSVRPEMITFIESIKEKYPLYLLSNQTQINTDYLHPLLDTYFKRVLFSNEVGMHKPDAQMYQLLLSSEHLKPNESLFVDDKKECIQAAEDLGLQTYLFREPASFFKDFPSNTYFNELKK